MELLTPAFAQIILLLAFVVPAILFLIAQYKILKIINSQNRMMAPGLIWLQCIPVFGFVWQFIVVSKISSSIRKEFASSADESSFGLPSAEIVSQLDKKPTLYIGITYCVLTTLGIVMNLTAKSRATVGLIAIIELAGMVCWIVYWVNLAKYKRILNRKTY
jgi:hypothetical protein